MIECQRILYSLCKMDGGEERTAITLAHENHSHSPISLPLPKITGIAGRLIEDHCTAEWDGGADSKQKWVSLMFG